jgi:hypothetical protein
VGHPGKSSGASDRQGQFTEAAENYRDGGGGGAQGGRFVLTLYRDGASPYLVTAQSAALDAERLTIILHTRQQPSSA